MQRFLLFICLGWMPFILVAQSPPQRTQEVWLELKSTRSIPDSGPLPWLEKVRGLLGENLLAVEPAYRWPFPSLQPYFLLRTKTHPKLPVWVTQLRSLPEIKGADIVPTVHAHYLPNDYDSTVLAHLHLIKAPTAWDLSKGHRRIRIAILDNGVLRHHPDLQANIWQNPLEVAADGLDNDGNGYIDDTTGWDVGDADADPDPPRRSFRHGSHIAGCAAAVTDNDSGVAAIGYGCALMPVKLASDNGFADSYPFSSVLKGMEYAIATGADILNMSFGTTVAFPSGQALTDIGRARGILLVAAAGNQGDSTLEYPASYTGVVSVAATDLQDKRASFATYNRDVDLCAPGVGINSTIPGSSLRPTYQRQQGSSQASGIVSGLLGLMLSLNPCLDPDEAERILKASAVNIDHLNPGYAGQLGAGRIDAAEALGMLGRASRPAASFNVLDTLTCTGRIQIRYAGIASACPDTWRWHCSNGQVSDLPHPVFLVDSSGFYDFSLKVSNAFGEDSLLRRVYIRRSAPLIDAGPDITLGAGDSMRLGPVSDRPLAWAKWSPGIGLDDSLALRPLLRADSSRSYEVLVRDLHGCEARDSLRVSVWPTAMKTPKIQVMPRAWPNPTRQTLYLEADFGRALWLEVALYSLEGKRLGRIYQGHTTGRFKHRYELIYRKSGRYVLQWRTHTQCFHSLLLIGE